MGDVIERLEEESHDPVSDADHPDSAAQGLIIADSAMPTFDELMAEIDAKEREIEILTAQLEAKTSELRRITNTIGWKLLSRFGRFKYRYLLPLYRFLGLMGPDRVATDKGAPALREKQLYARKTTHDVVCFPIIDWSFRFQRPQQLTSRLAESGHRVFYFKTTFHQDNGARVDEISDSIFEVQLPGPADLNLYTGESSERTTAEFLDALTEFRQSASIVECLCLVQLPFWFPLAHELRRKWGWRIVYDCMDEHVGFSTNISKMLRHEQALIEKSDLVLASSVPLFGKVSSTSRRTLLLRNGADFEHFRRPGPVRPLADVSRPIIGYHGAISEWFDIEMVRDAARARPDWQFVLVGSTFGSDVTDLEPLNNVHMPGEQPYLSLPGYLHDFDVAIIPFKRNQLTDATNPVKFYEYMSAGKPVVAVDLSELQPHKDLFYPVVDREDFVPQIERALSESKEEHLARRLEFARANTWKSRSAALLSATDELFPRVSIIIVSFNNPRYLKLCLNSIWEHSLSPRIEVLVVDNGSGPAVTTFLRRAAVKESRLRLILNGANLGFARANNIGIENLSDSDIVVFLNDDTVVTRGWISRLVRYLEDDRIGLVGPVTNNISNEARIEVDYDSIKDMPDFAERWVSNHEKVSFDIPVLALYCAATRRAVLDRVGGLDERFAIGMFEDDDFSARVKQAGLRVVCAQDVFVHHWGQASFKRMDQKSYMRIFSENKRRFEEKWGIKWQPHRERFRGP